MVLSTFCTKTPIMLPAQGGLSMYYHLALNLGQCYPKGMSSTNWFEIVQTHLTLGMYSQEIKEYFMLY